MWRCFARARRTPSLQEIYLSKAKLDGYRSTGAYTLLDLNQRYAFLRPGLTVIDLGAAPGGWTQVAVKSVESPPEKPRVLAVDMEAIEAIPGAKVLNTDVSKPDAAEKVFTEWSEPADVLLSDLGGDVTGDRDIDCSIHTNLNIDALFLAKRLLKPGGTVLLRMQTGYSEADHFTFLKGFFTELQRVQPSISVDDDREIYYLGKGWMLKKMKESKMEVSDSHLRAAALLAKSTGISIDGDVKQMLNQTLGGEMEDKKGEYAFLKDDEATLERVEKEMAGKLSFNVDIPHDFNEMEQMLEKLQKNHSAPEGTEVPGMSDESGEEEDTTRSGNESSAPQPDISPEAKTYYKEMFASLRRSQAELKTSDMADQEELSSRLVTDLEADMEREFADQPMMKDRIRRQKDEYDNWSKALKDRDVWGKGEK